MDEKSFEEMNAEDKYWFVVEDICGGEDVPGVLSRGLNSVRREVWEQLGGADLDLKPLGDHSGGTPERFWAYLCLLETVLCPLESSFRYRRSRNFFLNKLPLILELVDRMDERLSRWQTARMHMWVANRLLFP